MVIIDIIYHKDMFYIKTYYTYCKVIKRYDNCLNRGNLHLIEQLDLERCILVTYDSETGLPTTDHIIILYNYCQTTDPITNLRLFRCSAIRQHLD